MNFVKMILVLMMVLGFTGVAFGEDNVAEVAAEKSADGISVDFSTSFLSRYVSASGTVYHDDAVLQSTLHFENLPGLPEGMYADLWHSWSLNHGNLTDDFGDELNYIFGWKNELESGLQVDVGVGYLDLLDLMKGCDGDFLLLYAEVRKSASLPFSPFEVSTFLRSETHIDLSSDSGDGIYLIAGLDSSLAVRSDFSIDQRLALIYDSGAYNFGAGWVGNYGIDLNWQVTDNIAITPLSLKVYLPENSADGKGPQTIIGAGFSIVF